MIYVYLWALRGAGAPQPPCIRRCQEQIERRKKASLLAASHVLLLAMPPPPLPSGTVQLREERGTQRGVVRAGGPRDAAPAGRERYAAAGRSESGDCREGILGKYESQMNWLR